MPYTEYIRKSHGTFMNDLVALLPVVPYKMCTPITDRVIQSSHRPSPEAVFHHNSLSEGAPWHHFQAWDGSRWTIDDCCSVCCTSTNGSMTWWFTSPVSGDCKRCVLKATQKFLYLFRIISPVYAYYGCWGKLLAILPASLIGDLVWVEFGLQYVSATEEHQFYAGCYGP